MGGFVWALSFSLRGWVPCGSFSMIKCSLFALVGVFGLLVAMPAKADYKAKIEYSYRAGEYPYVADLATACQQSSSNRASYNISIASSSYPFKCQFDPKPGVGGGSVTVTVNARAVCQPGQVLTASWPVPMCSGNEPPPSCAVGTKGKGNWSVAGGAQPFQTGGCVAGCRVSMTEVHSCWGPAGGGDAGSYCVYSYESTGSACTVGVDAPGTVPSGSEMPRTDVPPTKPPAGKSCPSGTVQGGTDSAGTPICIGSGSDPKNSPPPPPKVESEKTTQNADGSTTTTKTTTTTNADGSTTTTIETVTKMPDGTTSSNTTKNTSDKPSGGAGKDDSEKENEKYDLCKQNPMLTICRNSSVSGSCAQVSCEGDAIQCATLRAAATMECRQKADEEGLKASPLTIKGQAAIDGTDLAGLPGPGKGDTYSVPALQAEGWLGAGGAFEDVTFTVFGQRIVIPLKKWTGYLVGLRYALMIVASLVSFRILSSAFLRE